MVLDAAGPPADEEAEAGPRFADRLAALVAERESQVVLGLDPDPQRLWPHATATAGAASGGSAAGASGAAAASGASAAGAPGGSPTGPSGATPASGGSAAERAALAVTTHCTAVIDAAGAACVAVKLQSACFERLGAPGWAALRAVAEHARAAGLLVIADAKRGDIDVSAAAYGQALVGTTPTPFGPVEGLGADAFTANPYMGRDTLAVLTGAARDARSGVFVLVRTSNPGARELQDVVTQNGEPVWARVARLVDELGAGDAPLADVGAVVGATAPEHIARLRELMPRAPFLLPGIGAQGGRVEDLAPAFAPGAAGGLVTASRSIVAAHERSGGAPAEAARAEAERLRAAAWALA